jgi:hypothetical protein
MTISNYGFWKLCKKGLLMAALSIIPAAGYAAKITVSGSTQAVIGATGVFSQDSLSDSKASAYLFDKPTAVVTMELDNGTTIDVALDFEQLVRRNIPVYGLGSDNVKHGSLDGTPARGLIQEILLAQQIGQFKVKGGYGDIHFEDRPTNGLSRSLQENNERRGERLLVSAETQLSNAKLSVTLYDGIGRKAVDLSRSIQWSDVMNVQSGDLGDRISVMAAADVGNDTTGRIRLAYANERNGTGDVDNKIALSASKDLNIADQNVNFMVQYIRHFTDSMKDMDSLMFQATTKFAKTTVYARGEVGDVQTSTGRAEQLQATLGAEHPLYQSSIVSVDAIGELRFAKLDREANEDTAWGALLGVRVSGAKTFDTASKN